MFQIMQLCTGLIYLEFESQQAGVLTTSAPLLISPHLQVLKLTGTWLLTTGPAVAVIDSLGAHAKQPPLPNLRELAFWWTLGGFSQSVSTSQLLKDILVW